MSLNRLWAREDCRHLSVSGWSVSVYLSPRLLSATSKSPLSPHLAYLGPQSAPPVGVPLFTSPPSNPSWTLGPSWTPEDCPQASLGPPQPASAALKMPHHHPGNFHFPSFHFSCFFLAFLWSFLPQFHPRTPSQGLHHHYHPSLARDPHVYLRKTPSSNFRSFCWLHQRFWSDVGAYVSIRKSAQKPPILTP